MMILVPFLIIGLLLVYTFQMYVYGSAITRTSKPPISFEGDDNLFVTLIVPVRNERNNLEELLECIINQDYPDDFMEVWFVDDHSEDGSFEFLTGISKKFPHFNVHRLASSSHGKKAAIHAACKKAMGEWIIQTDADCILPKGFISAHARYAKIFKGGLVAGPVILESSKGIWHRFEALEYLSLSAIGMASFLRNKPVMCSGASISFSREFYLEVAGDLLKAPSPSGDDIFLMIKAVKNKVPVSFIAESEAVVNASNAGNPGLFLQQRIRWASKTRHTSYAPLIYVALLVWLTNVALVAQFILVLIDYRNIAWFLIAFGLKLFADLLILIPATRFFNRRSLMKLFLPASLIYYFYITLAGALSLFSRFRWKGRSVKQPLFGNH